MTHQHRYKFTNDWFGITAKKLWTDMIGQVKMQKILEIGSYEGNSTCWLIDNLSKKHPLEIHCIDTWHGGVEHEQSDMAAVEQRFQHNTVLALANARNPVDLVTHKGSSVQELSALIAQGLQGYFDFVYVDGSHQAPDVLLDAVLGFQLLKVNGMMCFDDYLWADGSIFHLDTLKSPKIAIDAFTNIYCRKTQIIQAPLCQLFVIKIAE